MNQILIRGDEIAKEKSKNIVVGHQATGRDFPNLSFPYKACCQPVVPYFGYQSPSGRAEIQNRQTRSQLVEEFTNRSLTSKEPFHPDSNFVVQMLKMKIVSFLSDVTKSLYSNPDSRVNQNTSYASETLWLIAHFAKLVP